MRTMFVCLRASTLPTVIVMTANTQKSGFHTSRPYGNPTYTSVMSATNPAAFEATDRKAVTGVGAPS